MADCPITAQFLRVRILQLTAFCRFLLFDVSLQTSGLGPPIFVIRRKSPNQHRYSFNIQAVLTAHIPGEIYGQLHRVIPHTALIVIGITATVKRTYIRSYSHSNMWSYQLERLLYVSSINLKPYDNEAPVSFR